MSHPQTWLCSLAEKAETIRQEASWDALAYTPGKQKLATYAFSKQRKYRNLPAAEIFGKLSWLWKLWLSPAGLE
jgi:hypothetical protein